MSLLDATLAHLRALVAFDTRNPPRAIGTDGVFGYLRDQLHGFDVQVTDHGAGAVSLLAVRGKPKLLFNVHLDTVPDSPRWTASPFALRVTGERAIGLGACDIKGAAAGLLAAAAASSGDLALLFTSDEEGAAPRCVRAFLDSLLPAGEGARRADEGSVGLTHSSKPGPSPQPPSRRERGFRHVIVAEPTRCRAVLAHRGIQSVRVGFHGRAGHASAAQQPSDSAAHQAVRWGAAALDFAAARADDQFDGLRGMRFNLGRIEGGIKANMIAPEAEIRFGMRPLPSADMDDLLARLAALTEPAPAVFEETFRGPPLPADTAHAQAAMQAARVLVQALGVPAGDAVDFWTEAALFSQAGCTAFVYGPGDIAQAHGADEWVALEQLHAYAQSVHRMVAGGMA